MPAGPVSGPLAIGRVVEIEELKDFKKPIRACKVDVGSHNVDGVPRDIVCGATNFAVGDLVAVALPGSVPFPVTSRSPPARRTAARPTG